MAKTILLIYTGGTFGMQQEDGVLSSSSIEGLEKLCCELNDNYTYKVVNAFEKPLDSSDVQAKHWFRINELIRQATDINAVLIIHGTDTMAYTSSALSFLTKGVKLPIVLTGAQRSIHETESDAKSNLKGAIAALSLNKADQVYLHFDGILHPGTKVSKVDSQGLNAFESKEPGEIPTKGVQHQFTGFEENLFWLKIHPGINSTAIASLLDRQLIKGIILESYGAGNIPQDPVLLEALKQQIEQGSVVINVSQCLRGKVEMDRYENGKQLESIGVISAQNMTKETAFVKLGLCLFERNNAEAKILFAENYTGEY